MSQNEARQIVCDYLNGTYDDKELALKFELVKCESKTCSMPYQLDEESKIEHSNIANENLCLECRQAIVEDLF